MERCPVCDGLAALVREEREITVGLRTVRVEDEFYRCRVCEEVFYLPGMMDASLRRASDKIRQQEGLLTSEEILRLRESLGLSQAAFEKLIGAGPKTVTRWERGTVAQNGTADTLLRVLRDHPEIAIALGQEREVEVSHPVRT